MKVFKTLISLALAFQVSFSPNMTLGESSSFLSPRTIFSWRERVESYTLAFMVNAISLLSGSQSVDDFKKILKEEEIEAVPYNLEEEGELVQAVRFKSHDGKWYRLGKSPLGKTVPELGFLLASQTDKVDEFWLETFDRTMPVEIIVSGVVLGTVVKIEEGVDFERYEPRSVEAVDFEGYKPKDTPTDEVKEKDLLERMKRLVLARYDAMIDEVEEGENRKILEADRAMIEDLIDRYVGPGIGPSVSARESVGRVISHYVGHFSESTDPKFQSKAPRLKRIGEMMLDELERAILEKMKETVLDRLNKMIQRAGKEEESLWEAEKTMFLDPDLTYGLLEPIKALIGSQVNVREAVMRVIGKRIKTFKGLDFPYFQEKVLDLENIGQMMIDAIDGIDRLALLDQKIAKLAKEEQKVILVGRILPTHFTLAHQSSVVGMVTDRDEQRGSHNMVLAQGARVAFAKKVGQISSLEKELHEGDTVALELVISDRIGKSSLTLNPEPSHRFRIIRQTVERGVYEDAVSTLKSTTRDDRPVRLDLNVATHEELSWQKGEYRHIGLTRSDFDYLEVSQAPRLDELTQKYQKFFGQAMELGVEEITFRTFDLDLNDKKPICFHNSEKREGIDFSLNDPEGLEAFKTQVRAIFLSLGAHLDGRPPIKLKLLFPKVKRLEEYQRAVQIVGEIFQELKEQDQQLERIADYKVGIMVETKEALENIESFIGEVDFINVGTNDLTLSLFPDKVSRVTREGEGKAPISAYYHRILGDLERIVKAAASHPTAQRRPPICFCGELSSHAEYAQFLVGLGYRKLSLSMPYKSLLDLKLNIAAHDYAEIQGYTNEVLARIRHAEALEEGEPAESAYEELREFLRVKRAEMEESTLAYLAYEWAKHNISLERLIEVIHIVSRTLGDLGVRDNLTLDPDQLRREIAMMLAELGVFPERFRDKLLARGVDLEEFLTMLEVWAYQKLVDQGTFYVYRARKIGKDYWIRVLPTGEEYRWVSRYDRRIMKEADGTVWIKAGSERRFEARWVTLEDDPQAEVYAYEEGGETFYARDIDVRGVPFTHVRAGREKNYVIERFLKGAGQAGDVSHERLYKDRGGAIQIIHIPDWAKHPVLKVLPYYHEARSTPSVLLFLLNIDWDSGVVTWGQNTAKAGYGHLFENNSRVLEILIKKLKLIDVSFRMGRRSLKLIQALMVANEAVQETEQLRARVRELESLLERMGVPRAMIADPTLFDQAA